jgi:Kef-type K+ transport system membrane component KefB
MSWLSTLSEYPFYEFALILFFAAVLGGLGQLLKQPLIVMFIFLGILVGPSVLDIVKSQDKIDLLAEVGIAILLFIVGLKLDIRIIKSVGKIALLTGLGQVLFTSLIGYFLGLYLGFSSLHSFYIAVALTFSSTIIIVKLLSDKKEINSLHGQIAVGFLIVQDIVVILVMIVLSAMRQNEDTTLMLEIGRTILTGVLLLGLTLGAMKWVIPRLSSFLAKSQEMLTLFAIAWAVILASVSEVMGFSREVGAFLAGVSLASSQFKDVISSRLVSIRDFMLLFFFVNLGANLDLNMMGTQVSPAIVFSVFVLIGNPIIVLIIMGLMGYRRRTSFLAGLTVAQISEFSLIFAGLGLAAGHITEETVGLITLVGLITIGLSTYLILYSFPIYEFISPALKIFERKNPTSGFGTIDDTVNQKADVIIFGLGRFGSKIAETIDECEAVSYLGIDFDPQIVKSWQKKNRMAVYGDVDNVEILEHIPYKEASCIVITVPETDYSMQLIKEMRKNGYTGKIFTSVRNEKNRGHYSDYNVDLVLSPYKMAAAKFFESYLSGLAESKKEQH